MAGANPTALSSLPPDERAAVERLQSRYGDDFRFEIDGGHVTSVDLSNNRLTAVPPEVFDLTALTELSLGNNRLTAVPPEVGHLTALTTLGLSRNYLTAVPPEVGRLTALTRLDLANNHLTAVPPEVGNLTALFTLFLANNRLTAVPPEVGRLTALTGLNLSRNYLTAVPPEVGRLTALTALGLFGNPLPDPYPELDERGAPAVLAYLRSLADPARVVTLREARLILVGSGKVGKTQLKNALLGLEFQEHAPTTHGVEIERGQAMTLPCTKGGGDLTLPIWDFGGQETYEVTHQFFYGRRSVYLLVWHPRAATPDLGVEAWLRKLQLRLGPHARVIIVATHKDTDARPADLDLNGLRQKFGDTVLGFYQVENKSRDKATNGIPELKAAIAQAANDLSVVGMQVNRDWLALRDDLKELAKERTYIRRHEFDERAAARGLTPDTAAVWRNLLHDLGDLLYYGDVSGLEDFVVLRPDWLTGAVARVLDDAGVLRDRGVLWHARFRELWADHPPELYPFLHAVMEQFDICCRGEGEKWSLVGEKVPHDRPPAPPGPAGRRLRLVYEFDDEPPGLVPWLIVRSYRFTTGRHWRLGVYLAHDGHAAAVEFDRGSQRLTVAVEGPFPVNFFALLQDGVEQVLPRWEGLKDRVRRLVPCGQTGDDGDACPGFYQLRHLRTAAEKGKRLQCNECLNDGDPVELLAGIGVRAEPLAEQVADLVVVKLEGPLDRLRQGFQHQTRVLLRAMSDQAREAPRLFSLWPKNMDDRRWWERLDPRKVGVTPYELWLWCEHPEGPHPVKRYEVPIAARWLVKVAPYAKLVAGLLKAGVPVLGGVLGNWMDHIGASKEDKKEIAERIEAMGKLAEKCLTGEMDIGRKREEMADGLGAAEGAALREFHALLKEIDTESHWGDLRPTATKEGDHLWMCPEHHRLFNPGLITLPPTSA